MSDTTIRRCRHCGVLAADVSAERASSLCSKAPGREGLVSGHSFADVSAAWPDQCARCGATGTIDFDYALGFNCRACGGTDADE